MLADSCGLLDIPVTRVENQCATGNDAIRNAALAVGSGMVDVALVLGADKTRETSTLSTFWDWMGMARDKAWDYPLGLIAPASFALHVARYMHEYDVRPEHLAMVAVKNHHNAVTNPMAHLRFEVTVEQVLAAPRVAGPFGVLDCAPQSDGAAAVLLVAGELADRYTDCAVWVRGFGLAFDRVMHAHKHDMTSFPSTLRAAKAAFAMAGIGPTDIDVAEVHDCFTGVELMNYEDLGLLRPGRGSDAHRVWRYRGRGPYSRQPQRRPEGERPSARRDWGGAVRRAVRAAAGKAANQVDGARWATGPERRRADGGLRGDHPGRPGMTGPNVIVTGAGQGLGAAVAAAFAAGGAAVVLADVAAERAEIQAASIRGTGGKAIAAQADVCDEDAVLLLAQQCRDAFGPVDVWVNNAGITRPAMLKNMSVDDFMSVLDVHVRGTFLGIRTAAREMIAHDVQGVILNVTSSAGSAGHDRPDQLLGRQGRDHGDDQVGGQGARASRHPRERRRPGRRDADDADDPHRREAQRPVSRQHPAGALRRARTRSLPRSGTWPRPPRPM